MSMFTRRVFGRRQFLRSATASVIATAALGPRVFAAEGTTAPAKSLAVGFARTAEKAHLVAASSIPSSDGTFIGTGARIAVSGSSGTTGTPRLRRTTELRTNFSYFEGAELRNAPFRTWSASRVTGEQGNSIRFTVPVDVVQKVSLTVVVESGDQTAGAPTSRRRAIGPGGMVGATELPLVLSVQNDPSAIPLVRGYYVIVPLFGTESTPSWSSYRLFQIGGRWTLVDEAEAPAPFEHLVLHVDYATP